MSSTTDTIRHFCIRRVSFLIVIRTKILERLLAVWEKVDQLVEHEASKGDEVQSCYTLEADNSGVDHVLWLLRCVG